MIKGKTRSGFEFSVSRRILDDWRFTLAIADAESKDPSRSVQGSVNCVRLLLGDQEESLYAHIAEADGTIPKDKIGEEVADIIKELGKTQKNS